jgi:hypothetical protein
MFSCLILGNISETFTGPVSVYANARPDDTCGGPIKIIEHEKKFQSFWYIKVSSDEKIKMGPFYNFYILLIK